MCALPSKVKLSINVIGIFVSFLVFGLLQEKIMKHQRYGEEVQDDGKTGVKFTLSIALVFVLTICYCTFAKGSNDFLYFLLRCKS